MLLQAGVTQPTIGVSYVTQAADASAVNHMADPLDQMHQLVEFIQA